MEFLLQIIMAASRGSEINSFQRNFKQVCMNLRKKKHRKCLVELPKYESMEKFSEIVGVETLDESEGETRVVMYTRTVEHDE